MSSEKNVPHRSPVQPATVQQTNTADADDAVNQGLAAGERDAQERTLNLFNYVEHYTIDAEEFDYFEARRGGTAHEERRVHEYLIAEIPKQVTSILDVGTGSAWVAETFAPKGVSVCSADISLRNTATALRRYPYPNHTAVVADVFAMPFAPASFECIIASEIIEHVVNPALFVQRLVSLLKPGGTLLVSTPYKEVLQYSLCVHCNHKTPLHAHIHSFDEAKLLSLCPPDAKATYTTFGNKALIHARTHVALKVAPFPVWRLIDRAANLLYNRPAHILVKYRRTTAAVL